MLCPEIQDFQVDVYEHKGIKEIKIRIGLPDNGASDLEKQDLIKIVTQDLYQKLYLRAENKALPPGSLPGSTGKVQRFSYLP